jgi:hypothetical protein
MFLCETLIAREQKWSERGESQTRSVRIRSAKDFVSPRAAQTSAVLVRTSAYRARITELSACASAPGAHSAICSSALPAGGTNTFSDASSGLDASTMILPDRLLQSARTPSIDRHGSASAMMSEVAAASAGRFTAAICCAVAVSLLLSAGQ